MLAEKAYKAWLRNGGHPAHYKRMIIRLSDTSAEQTEQVQIFNNLIRKYAHMSIEELDKENEKWRI